MTYESKVGCGWARARLVGALALSMVFLAGCPEHRGPLEQAGHDVDQAAQQVGDGIDHAVQDVQQPGH